MGLPIHALAVAVDDCKTTAPFYIQVVDQETGRGIPLAMVSTQDWVVWWTDSNGIAAITESDLQPDPATGRSGDVWIYVSSWGYTDPADGDDAAHLCLHFGSLATTIRALHRAARHAAAAR